MKLIELEKRLGRWIRSQASTLFATVAVTICAAGLIGSFYEGLVHTRGGRLASSTGVFFVWALILVLMWSDE